MTELNLAQLVLDMTCQPRATIDPDLVAEYEECYRSGVAMPPVTVYADDVGGRWYLADGWHRYLGAQATGRKKIACDVHRGDLHAAWLHSLGANARHGARRTAADKRRAVLAALERLWQGHGDYVKIAKICEVSARYVSDMHRKPERSGLNVAPAKQPAGPGRDREPGEDDDDPKPGRTKAKPGQAGQPTPPARGEERGWVATQGRIVAGASSAISGLRVVKDALSVDALDAMPVPLHRYARGELTRTRVDLEEMIRQCRALLSLAAASRCPACRALDSHLEECGYCDASGLVSQERIESQSGKNLVGRDVPTRVRRAGAKTVSG